MIQSDRNTFCKPQTEEISGTTEELADDDGVDDDDDGSKILVADDRASKFCGTLVGGQVLERCVRRLFLLRTRPGWLSVAADGRAGWKRLQKRSRCLH
jgi:hypothetical protein